MTFPKSLDRGRGTWCAIYLTSGDRIHNCMNPTDKTVCGNSQRCIDFTAPTSKLCFPI